MGSLTWNPPRFLQRLTNLPRLVPRSPLTHWKELAFREIRRSRFAEPPAVPRPRFADSESFRTCSPGPLPARDLLPIAKSSQLPSIRPCFPARLRSGPARSTRTRALPRPSLSGSPRPPRHAARVASPHHAFLHAFVPWPLPPSLAPTRLARLQSAPPFGSPRLTLSPLLATGSRAKQPEPVH